MTAPRRSAPDDAPMLLPPARIVAVVIVFILFLLLGRLVGEWLDGGQQAERQPIMPASTPSPTIELAETSAPA